MWCTSGKHVTVYCIVLIAEVTQVSLGVGYEIGRAVAMKKPILCLYRQQNDKSMTIGV